MVKNIDMVVFDMAGTTVDEGGTVYRTLQRALRRGGHDFEYDEILQAAGRSKFSAIEQLLGLRMDAVDRELSQKIHEDFRQLILTTYLEEGVSEQPGASKVFRLLKDRGVRIVLNTGYDRQTADTILDGLGWKDHGTVDLTVTSDDVARGRPSPDMIIMAMSRLGMEDPGKVAKVGDSKADIEEGLAAGCGLVVGVTTGAHTRPQLQAAGAAAVIDGLEELPPLLRLQIGGSGLDRPGAL